MQNRVGVLTVILGTMVAFSGCKHPKITAVSLDPCHFGKETGIPFYLPKPLLIVAKNFRNIEEPKVGLTASPPIPNHYDDQSKYADLNARTNFAGLGNENTGPQTTANPANTVVSSGGSASVQPPVLHSENGAPVTPGDAPSDGLAPATFYTYHIVFIPDMSQKYGLKIRGGPGEIRAAMNLVNGWQFTGIGPFYMKDSSTAQNVLAGGISARLGGQAVADVLKGVADLSRAAGGLQAGEVDAADNRVQSLAKTIQSLPQYSQPMEIPNFAEIRVYEPTLLPDGRMEWSEIVNLCFNRSYLGMEHTSVEFCPETSQASTQNGNGLQSSEVVAQSEAELAKTAIAGLFGIPPDSPALTAGAGLQSGESMATAPAGAMNQIQVDCGDSCSKPSKEFSIFRFDGWKKHKTEPRRGRIETKVVRANSVLGLVPGSPTVNSNTEQADIEETPQSAGPGLQSGETTDANRGTIFNDPILNQPVLNQPVVNPADPSTEEPVEKE